MEAALYHVHHQLYEEDQSWWLDITQGQEPILELGSGTGRVTIPLSRAGRKVWGVDHDLEMLKLGLKNLERENDQTRERVKWLAAEMTALSLEDKTFRSIIIPCNTYSTLSQSDRAKLLAEVHRCLLGGGLFAFSVPNPLLLKDIQGEDDLVLEEVIIHPVTGNSVQVSSLIQRERGGIAWTWVYDELLPDGQVNRSQVKTLHSDISREGYIQEGLDAGFSVAAEYGNFTRLPWGADSPYLIVVLEK
ncbi:MAG: methyltransferase domain-containing protein [Anaerolineales bacterium]|nr:methyltransferase domain-containing protein [Anaerolineales bacterium]